MRSIPRGTFERSTSFESLWRAWCLHRRGKRRKQSIAEFDLDADRILAKLHRELRAGSYRPGPYIQHVVRDPKLRLVSAPALRDRVLHQSLVAELAPHYERSYLADSYACRPGKGPLRAALRHLGWMRRHRFALALDIRSYFASIHHRRLLQLLEHRLRDLDTRELLRMLVESGGDVYHTALARRVLGPVAHRGIGMPVGSCLSQWAANLYLDGLDHFVKRELNIPGYLRYMDDFVLFADEHERLEGARAAIREWLERERALELKPGCGRVGPTSEPRTFLGYRISRAGLSPSRKLRRRLAERVALAGKRGPSAVVRTVRSYVGLLVGP